MREVFPGETKSFETKGIKEKKGLKEHINEKILDALEPFLSRFLEVKENRKDYEKIKLSQEDSQKLSSEAGEFFKSLIPKGLKKPDVNINPHVGSTNWIMLSENAESTKLLMPEVRGLSRKEYRAQRNEILKESVFGRDRKATKGEVREIESRDGSVEQHVMNIVEQEGGANLIYEKVTNHLNKKAGSNRAYASLLIQNKDTGATVDLNALLPSEYVFVPRAMDKELFVPDAESITGITYQQKEVANLKEYTMGESDPEGFAVRLFYKNINYGDIRKTGGMLSLLHEVAHSWQNKYHNKINEGRTGFEEMYNTVSNSIYRIEILKSNDQHEEREKIWEELEILGFHCLDKNGLQAPLEEEGVINIPNIYSSLISFIKMLNLSDSSVSKEEKEAIESLLSDLMMRLRFYPIKSEHLQKVLNSYIAEERDAWAHALRTMRFLKSKGIDIEPELKKPEDFKAIIEPCLASYQYSLDMILLNQKNDYKFSKILK